MHKRRYCFPVLLLSILLIFMGCGRASAGNPSPNSEIGFEGTESEKIVETEGTESSKAIQAEKHTDYDSGRFHPYFRQISKFKGVLIRWGSVIGDRFHPDFPDIKRDEILELFMVNVEVLDAVEYEYMFGADVISELNVIFLPKKAVESIEEGEEALVFLYTDYTKTENGETVPFGYVLEPTDESVALPIFRYENGKMMISEEQMEKRSNGVYKMIFLRNVYRANEYLLEHERYKEYCFRDGMSIEELEQFYKKVRDLPSPG